jgi:hypothetical protein
MTRLGVYNTVIVGDKSMILKTSNGKKIGIETRRNSGLAIWVDNKKIFECDVNGKEI